VRFRILAKNARMIARRTQILRETKGVSLRMTKLRQEQAAAGSPPNAERTSGQGEAKR
jgi:hypothetical protein